MELSQTHIISHQNIKPFNIKINNKNVNFCVIPVNNKSIRENFNWKEKNNYTGCIYSNPKKGLRHINMNEIILIIEANMEINEINGMGILIKEEPQFYKYKIYEDNNSNRYSYKGKYHFDKESLVEMDNEFIENIEKLIFTGYWHLKRIDGISLISKRLVEINEKLRDNKIDFTKFGLKFDKYI